MNVTDRMVKNIDDVLPHVTDRFDREKLSYIRSQITPAGLARRPEEEQDVSHLVAVGRDLLRRFRSRKETPDAS